MTYNLEWRKYLSRRVPRWSVHGRASEGLFPEPRRQSDSGGSGRAGWGDDGGHYDQESAAMCIMRDGLSTSATRHGEQSKAEHRRSELELVQGGMKRKLMRMLDGCYLLLSCMHAL